MFDTETTPLYWTPKGVSDTLDSTESFPGAQVALTNLIPDPSSPNLWQCRAAAVQVTNFSGFNTPGFISCLHVAGNYAYGMIATNRNPGHDEPFVYNLATNAFVTVTGTITAATTPASPATTGAWTPPIMDIIGSKVVLTHPGFAATANFIGWIDISVPATPVWNAGNTTGAITFSTIPTFVAQFNNRAYYIVNTLAQPALVFSDPLNATNVTAGTQSLTFGDVVPLTCLGQLRLYNQLGGIIQGLIVFKGVQNCYQITGDAATNNLALNALNVATGTLAPLALSATKAGLAFISPDGARIIDFTGTVSDPVGRHGQGICVPFVYAVQQSRMVMAASGDVVRVSTQNGAAINTPQQEWWYHMTAKAWSGPHTFPASLIQPWNNTFIMAPIGITGSLWQSDVVQSVSSVYVENGTQLSFNATTSFLPNVQQLAGFAMSFTTLDIALNPGTPVTVTAMSQDYRVFDTTQIAAGGGGGSTTVWGSFTWGASPWGSLTSSTTLVPRLVNWHMPIVAMKLALMVNGPSSGAIKVGGWGLRIKVLRYFQDITAAAV
jgi:hypothetical protein